VLASVAVPASGWSRAPSPAASYAPDAFEAVRPDALEGTATTTKLSTDSALDSAGALVPDARLQEPPIALPSAAPPGRAQPAAPAPVTVFIDPWHHNPDESWYGPGFYGQHTACGQVLTETLRGVANRTLPCGTLVTFRNPNNGMTITVPVVDRGPYVAGREWDLTHGACDAINHCWTGPLDWRFP
jgi:hypothetical protein